MINHARALLLNISGEEPGFIGLLGDEYVPPAYRAISLPSYLQNIRTILFAKDPDRVFMNFRLWQYMAILHATELKQYVLELDPRTTYDLATESMLAFDVQYDAASVHFVQPLSPPDQSGRCFHQWKLEVTASDTVVVTRQTAPKQSSEQIFSTLSGWSSSINLVGSDAQVKIVPVVGQVLRISGYARPTRDLGQILMNLDSLGQTDLLPLFGAGSTAGAAEPLKTFRNLWNRHSELSYRLGAVLCAVIYQTERLRNG